jgi:hypothetical protein
VLDIEKGKKMFSRKLLAAGATGAALLGIAAPATAQAATPITHVAVAHAAAASTQFTLGAGQSGDVPTWFWGSTRVCGTNSSNTVTVMELASRSGATPVAFLIPAHTTTCHSEWWWGVPLQVVNFGPAALTITAS